MTLSPQARKLTQHVLDSLKPNIALTELISVKDSNFVIGDRIITLKARIHIFCVGKAASQQAKAVKDFFKANDLQGKLGKIVAYTKIDHSIKEEDFLQLEGDHPFISEKNIEQTNIFLKELSSVDSSEQILFFISGGASALLEKTKEGIGFDLLHKIYKELVLGDRDIRFINSVRKALSLTKNGGLLNYFKTSDCVAFITSDIPGNILEDVGSGPLHPSILDYEKINAFLKDYDIELSPEQNKLAAPETFLLQAPETTYKYIHKVEASAKGSKTFDGSLESLMEYQKANLPGPDEIFVSGGEASLHIKGKAGLGGRNTHFVLAMARELYRDEKNRDLHILSLGTDGTDGPTDAAGAYINYEIYEKNRDLENYLRDYDSYSYFKKTGSLIKTGPTGTNIMDIRFLWRE